MAIDVQTLLPARPPVAALGMFNRILLWAIREWLRAAMAREAVTPALRAGLETAGMAELAGPVAELMEEATAAWPEKLRLHPVHCGCPVSYDEWLLLRCLADARRGARPEFDARLEEMIGRTARDRIWRAVTRIAAAAG